MTFILCVLRGALWRAVIVRTSVWVLRLPLGDGLHGRWEQSAAHAVAAAVGGRGDSGAALPGRSRCGEGFGREALSVGFGVGAGDLIWPWIMLLLLLQGGGEVLGLPGQLGQRISRWFRSDGALEDLCRWHAVTGVRAAALFEQQQFEFLVGGARLLYVPVDGHGDSLRARGGHGGGGRHQWDWGAGGAAGWCVSWCSSETVPRAQLRGVFPTQHFPFGPEDLRISIKNLCGRHKTQTKRRCCRKSSPVYHCKQILSGASFVGWQKHIVVLWPWLLSQRGCYSVTGCGVCNTNQSTFQYTAYTVYLATPISAFHPLERGNLGVYIQYIYIFLNID